MINETRKYLIRICGALDLDVFESDDDATIAHTIYNRLIEAKSILRQTGKLLGGE